MVPSPRAHTGRWWALSASHFPRHTMTATQTHLADHCSTRRTALQLTQRKRLTPTGMMIAGALTPGATSPSTHCQPATMRFPSWPFTTTAINLRHLIRPFSNKIKLVVVHILQKGQMKPYQRCVCVTLVGATRNETQERFSLESKTTFVGEAWWTKNQMPLFWWNVLEFLRREAKLYFVRRSLFSFSNTILWVQKRQIVVVRRAKISCCLCFQPLRVLCCTKVNNKSKLRQELDLIYWSMIHDRSWSVSRELLWWK